MQHAVGLHLSRHVDEIHAEGLRGQPEKLNEAFRDLPGYGEINVAWLQVVLIGELPCCPHYGDPIEVSPADVNQDRSLTAFRRRDGTGFPCRSTTQNGVADFYTIVLADSECLPSSFHIAFVEVDDADAVGLNIVRGEWMLRKPVDGNIHLHVAVQMPAHTNNSRSLTQEQHMIVRSPKLGSERGIVRILAAAGSGKTTTLQAIADTIQPSGPRSPADWHTLYIVFNKSMQQEADGKFRRTFVQCRTWDALAHAYVRRNLNNGEAFEIVDNVEQHLQNGDRLIWRVVQKFCQSKDLEISKSHLEQVEDGVNVTDVDGAAMSDEDVLHSARMMYSQYSSLMGVRPDHSVVLKMCQMDMVQTQRRFSYPAARLLLCDEFQDINPVQESIVSLEASLALVVVVGDPGQSIYKFRGACTALQDLRGQALKSFTLSGSFRFGPEIAAYANIAQSLHADDALSDYETIACRGVSGIDGEVIWGDFPHVRPQTNSYTVICRTSRQVVTLALELRKVDAHRRIIVLGQPLHDELNLMKKLLDLRQGRLQSIDYGAYRLPSFAEAESCGLQLKKFFKDFALDRAVQMVKQNGHALHSLLPQENRSTIPEAVFCTVHQAKGLEWENVVLGHGCNVSWDKEFGVWELTHDVINCLYVAMTRAQRCLWLPNDVADILATRTELLREIRTPVCQHLIMNGIHQLFHLVDAHDVERIKKAGWQAIAAPFYCALSGTKVLDRFSSQDSSDAYVVEIDMDIVNLPGIRFRLQSGDNFPIDELPNINTRDIKCLEVLVPREVDRKYIRRIYPLCPEQGATWSSRHGNMSADQWFTSFGSDRQERAERILAGTQAARRGARSNAWEIDCRPGVGIYDVPSQSQAGVKYRVNLNQGTCNCPDHQQRGRSCKHILAAKAFQDYAS